MTYSVIYILIIQKKPCKACRSTGECSTNTCKLGELSMSVVDSSCNTTPQLHVQYSKDKAHNHRGHQERNHDQRQEQTQRWRMCMTHAVGR